MTFNAINLKIFHYFFIMYINLIKSIIFIQYGKKDKNTNYKYEVY